jgi:SAM-dependent methyltransferase
MAPLRNSIQRFVRVMQQRITPGVRYHQDTFVDVLGTRVPDGGRWLDLGCGHRLLPSWQSARERELIGRAGVVVGVDYDFESVRRHATIACRCRGDIGSLPFPASSFDLVTANMVVEHLDAPERQFREVARVLRPGGTFLYHTPNAENYQVRLAQVIPEGLKAVLARVFEGRRSEDVFPTHYRANTAWDTTRLAQESGLVVDRIDFISSYPGLGAIPPLAFIELLGIRWLEQPGHERWRHNLICALRKAPAQ